MPGNGFYASWRWFVSSVPQLVGCLLLVAAGQKVHQVISGHVNGLVGLSQGILFSFILISFEVVLGLCLLARIYRATAIRLAILTFLTFIGVHAYLIGSRQEDICGCFGTVTPQAPGMIALDSLCVLGLTLALYQRATNH